MIHFLCVLLLLSHPLQYEEALPETAEMTGIYEVESGLTEEEREISGGLTVDGSYDAGAALLRLWKQIRQSAGDRLRSEVNFVGGILGMSLLCALAGALCPDGKIPAIAELASCCAVSLLLAGNLESVIRETVDALNRIADYAKAALPCYFTACAAAGAAVSASAKNAALLFALDMLIEVSQKLILPMIQAFLAVSICAGVFDNAILTATGRIVKWCAVTAMTLMTTGLGLAITLSGAIAGSADQFAVKTTKTVISTALPVVGGILSDSASSILAAAELIKNSAGVFCLVAVCVLCAGPFVMLLVKLLLFKASAAVSELACGGRMAQLLSQVGTAFAMLLGLLGSYGLMLFLSIMSGIRMVTP